MTKPIIGISPLYDRKLDGMWMNSRYINAVRYGGGIPVVIPFSESEAETGELIKSLDGILFTGGGDIDPSYYGQEKMPLCDEPEVCRDKLEKLLFNKAYEMKKPILGICRGIQVINVMLGGSLYQDIGSQTSPAEKINHSQEKPYDIPAHKVRIIPDTPLYALLGKEEIMVNSMHHQAVLELEGSLKPAAFAPDGIIEALFMPGERFLWGVQWHPEHMFLKDEASALIFRKFIDACR